MNPELKGSDESTPEPVKGGIACFEVTGEMLAEFFGFAKGCVIDRIERPIDRVGYQLRVRGPGLEECPEGAVIRQIYPHFHVVSVDKGHVALEDVRELRMDIR